MGLFDTVPTVTVSPQNMVPVDVSTNDEREKLKRKLATLSPQDRTQVETMKNSLVVTDFDSITKFASQVNGSTGAIVDGILKTVGSTQLDNIGGGINTILMDAKKINGSTLGGAGASNAFTRLPIISMFFNTKEKILAQFSSLATQIDKTGGEIKKSMILMQTSVKTMEDMGKNCVKQYNQLEAMIAAAQLRLMDLRDEVAVEQEAFKVMPQDQVDPLQYQALQKKINYVDTLGKKIANMETTQQVIYIQIPQLELMIKNSIDATNEFQSILDTTIPVWKTSFTQAIIIDQQQKAADLIKSTKDFTNNMLKQNATNLKTATIQLTQQGSRPLVDIDTIIFIQNEFLLTIEGCKQSYEQAATQRKELSKGIENARLEFKKKLQEK